MKIAFSKSAIDDLKGIKAYYLEQGVPKVAQDFIVAIMAHIETLSEHPDIGRLVPEFNDNSIRELIHAHFRIVYLRDTSTIKIIRVWRSERQLILPET
ncbi:MAG: type II toxin-antitoxin system RelE/ParE family toxin [Marinomonas sp.]